MADDNAEHLFKYIKDKKDGIKKFVHKSGYFKTRKDAEKRRKEMEKM